MPAYDGRGFVTMDLTDGKLPAAVDVSLTQGVPGAVQTALDAKADTTAMDDKVNAATLAAVTINGVAPDGSGNYTIATGTGTGTGTVITTETSPGSGLFTVSAA